MAYARKNLGDDIFIKMLLEKYPKIDFFMRIKEKEFLEGLVKYKNLKILIGEDTDEELYKMNEDEFELDQKTWDAIMELKETSHLIFERAYNKSLEKLNSKK